MSDLVSPQTQRARSLRGFLSVGEGTDRQKTSALRELKLHALTLKPPWAQATGGRGPGETDWVSNRARRG